MSFLYWFLLGFGLGRSKIMPGTVGTLGMAIVSMGIFAIVYYMGINFLYLRMVYLVLLVLIVGLMLVAYTMVFKCFASHTTLKVLKADDGSIVSDEWIGILLVYLLSPSLSFGMLLWGFVIFRFFDIVKPWPIRMVDKQLQNVWGVILDDVLASLYTLALLYIMLLY